MFAGGSQAHGSQREPWLECFDAALTELSRQRPLSESIAELLHLLTEAFRSPHGYIRVGTKDGGAGDGPGLRAQAGSGCWSFDLPEDIDEQVHSTGTTQGGSVPGVEPGFRYLVAPVLVEAAVVGSIGVAYDGDDAPDHTEAESLVVRFASLVAIVYSNARLITTERVAREQEKALIRAGQALSSTLELRDVLNRILSELRKVVPYDTASVQELRGDKMVIVGGDGIDMAVFAGIGFDTAGAGVPNSEVLRLHEPVIVPDILGDHPYFDFPHDAHEMSGVRGWMGVPLMFGNECIGMVTLDTFEVDFYTEDHAETALAFAAQAAIALQNARSFEMAHSEVEERRRAEDELRAANENLKVRMTEIESLQNDLREQAIRDALTALFNRRYLIEALPGAIARCERDNVPLTVAMLDVDQFKAVNDSLGHDVGDQVLRAVADYLASNTRDGDVACRYGGEEFVVLLPGTSFETALQRAEQWRAEIAALVVPSIERPSVTVSIGVAAHPDHTRNGEALVRLADAAMYEAKSSGRNRVVGWGAFA